MKSRVKSSRISPRNNKRSSARPRRKRTAATAELLKRLRKDGDGIANLLGMPPRLPLHIAIPIPMAKEDWEHALGLLEHLDRCHSGTLYVPGVGSALRHSEKVGIHCADPAWRLVDELIYRARTRCARELGREGSGYKQLSARHRREQLESH